MAAVCWWISAAWPAAMALSASRAPLSRSSLRFSAPAPRLASSESSTTCTLPAGCAGGEGVWRQGGSCLQEVRYARVATVDGQLDALVEMWEVIQQVQVSLDPGDGFL
jgi:hypothetical protein